MSPANIESLRDRRRAELLSQIQHTAYKLFAERGFDAVTTEDIATAAGISISTYFRHAPTKEGLLVDPVRQAFSNMLDTFSAAPADESAVEVLMRIFVNHAKNAGVLYRLGDWQRAIVTAPHLLSNSSLVRDEDQRRFVELVAERMGVDAAVDIRPSLLVYISLATVKFVVGRWLTDEAMQDEPMDVQLEKALRITLAGFG
ncbi:TetR family transcriptional regulator [Mycobacterium intermedium]|uniref:TetR family transcriptional regulator n=1 Tax=Mycobacterium intermedium TaxID=28445 RepID=A0A1E3SN98_MYCIE|nr:TetR/AcrR family transcriptional regulator [Mycobacterium intermedium]MCV6964724.1 TetR family transcriptional regulator [Mycobacterium intermedium]ODR03103.1 TetR family transcriptional regulator [Mycobacterium intermedium]OPE47626.1 TetR family transcriptional regulator [Mycobacterium intermedium]ORB06836.1 TetR family transcriptional regulator [Mycobacterium intermedium]